MNNLFSSILAKEIYAQALAKLPSAETVNVWSSGQFTGMLRHDQSNPAYDTNVRQLLHVGFKIAAIMGET